MDVELRKHSETEYHIYIMGLCYGLFNIKQLIKLKELIQNAEREISTKAENR